MSMFKPGDLVTYRGRPTIEVGVVASVADMEDGEQDCRVAFIEAQEHPHVPASVYVLRFYGNSLEHGWRAK